MSVKDIMKDIEEGDRTKVMLKEIEDKNDASTSGAEILNDPNESLNSLLQLKNMGQYILMD